MCPSVEVSMDAPIPPELWPLNDVTDPVTQILLKILNDLEIDRYQERCRRREERRLRKERKQMKKEELKARDKHNCHGQHDEKLKKRILRNTRARIAVTPALRDKFKDDVIEAVTPAAMMDRLMDVTMSDIVLPEHSGWMTDLGTEERVYCVVADMIFCVFDTDESERPRTVILLPGCSVRSLFFKSAASNTTQTDLSKTVSGITKYHIIIDECSSKKTHSYCVETKVEVRKWMAVLKTATSLDNDPRNNIIDRDDQTSVEKARRHSLCGPVSVVDDDLQTHVTPNYAPCKSSSRAAILKTSHESPEQSPLFERKNDLNSTISGTPGDSLSVFRRRLRRDVDSESSKPQPLKATHFENHTGVSHNKKLRPFKKLKSFGSLDNLFKRSRHKSGGSESPDSNSLDDEDRGSNTSLNDVTDGKGTAFRKCSSTSDLEKTRNRALSRSLDFGKSEKGFGNGLFRTASDLKDKISGSKLTVRLCDLTDIKMSGYLQQKSVLKWQTMWFVVSQGCLFGFKSNDENETASYSLKLTNCQINYNIQENGKKYKRYFVFKLSHKHKRSVYLSANSSMELGKWLQCLHMESNRIHGDPQQSDVTDGDHGDEPTIPTTNGDHDMLFVRTERSVGVARREKVAKRYTDDPRRYSCPVTVSNGHHPQDSDTDSRQSSTDDSGSYSSRASGGFSTSDFPDHDPAVKQVWSNDRNYLFNLVRAKLRSYRKRRENGHVTDVNGTDADFIVVNDDGKELTPRTSGGRAVRRTRSFNVKPSSQVAMEKAVASSVNQTTTLPGKSEAPGNDVTYDELQRNGVQEEDSTSSSPKKKHKPLVVKKLPAREVQDPTLSGYLERKGFSDQWIRYWYILKGSSLFCYLSPDDNVTVDILDLNGYTCEQLVDQFRGKRFVLHLHHPDFCSVHLSLDSREEMEEWTGCVTMAKEEPPSAQAIVAESVVTTDASPEPYQNKCVSVKQKLLEEMLRQKHELEKKQAARMQKSKNETLVTNGKEMTSEEKQISYATNLRQRRLSTQIKMESINKQLQAPQSSAKKFFNFGGKKKTPDKNSEHLQEQLKELNNKLQEIDMDLITHINSSNVDSSFDLNQNTKQTTGSRSNLTLPNGKISTSSNHSSIAKQFKESEKDMNRANSFKANVKKLAKNTFGRSFKQKLPKSELTSSQILNGYDSDPSVFDNNNYDHVDSGDNYDGSDGETFHRTDSLTDLTKSPDPQSLTSSPDRHHIQPEISLRKEINPDLMAEIDAFEEMTKQALSGKLSLP